MNVSSVLVYMFLQTISFFRCFLDGSIHTGGYLLESIPLPKVQRNTANGRRLVYEQAYIQNDFAVSVAHR